MIIKTSCNLVIIIYIYSVNSLNVDVSYSNKDISKETGEVISNESNNEVTTESSSFRNQSIENIIPISDSVSLENYSFGPDQLKFSKINDDAIISSMSNEETETPTTEPQTENPSVSEKTLKLDGRDSESDEILVDRRKMLSSDEETKRLWPPHDDLLLGKLLGAYKKPENNVHRNSTIEGSERKYQENITVKSNDEDDYSALDDYPYTVSVQRKGAHYTTGALVGEKWVLTTAAEFYNVRESIKLFSMRLGSVDCKKGGVITPIKTIIIHPDFVPGLPQSDLAMLRMAQSVPMSAVIKPLGISRVEGEVLSAKFLVTYWPRIVVKNQILPPTAKERIKYNSMRVSTQKLVPTDVCKKLTRDANLILRRSSLCLKPVTAHHSDCMPDAGAPVVAVDGLWGITSGWVPPDCPATALPTIFTRVSEPVIRVWIEDQMRV